MTLTRDLGRIHNASFLYQKVGLHYGDYRSKLVHFEEQKNIFYIKKDIA